MKLSVIVTQVVCLLLLSTLTLSAGTLDDYYLQQFGEIKNDQLHKAVLSASPETVESARCGMPLKHALKRDWNLLEDTTQKVLAKQLALPVLSGTEQTSLSPTGKFRIHFTISGTDASSSSWVQTVAQTFDNVASSYSALNWQLAPTTNGAPYEVYLRNLAPEGYYGVTNSDISASSASHPFAYTSWMELDNNFTDAIYKPNFYTPTQSLQITAAHEYHHAIQYGYNYYFDIWYAEATSTWMEDELYDSVNQLYSYLPAWFGNSTTPLDLAVDRYAVSSGAGYGRWLFNRYLTEQHGGAMVRGAWERLAGISSSVNDIPMLPVLEGVLSAYPYYTTLGTDFFGFAKRVYTQAWSSHTSEIGKIHPYASVASFDVYPVTSSVNTETPSVTLPHYSFAYYTFTPTSGVTSLTLSITRDSGIQTALYKNGTEVGVNGSSYTLNGLGIYDEIALLVTNSSGMDNQSASFTTNGKLVLTSGSTTPPPSSTGTSCFIATAAYGSYLHPQVQQLRNFRDNYLLTNAPGRMFVAFYYHYSPPLADIIARHPTLRGATRLLLTPLVMAVAHPGAAATALFLLAVIIPIVRVRHKSAKSAVPCTTAPVA